MDVEKYIPIKTIVGPGSQPEEFGDDNLDYINMPKSMDTFTNPSLPEAEDLGEVGDALALMHAVQKNLANYDANNPYNQFDLSKLNAESFDLINQMLGVGEVSATIEIGSAKTHQIQVQESVMAGIWRIRHIDKASKVTADYIEVGIIPAAITETCFKNAKPVVDPNIEGEDGIINAPSILVELNERGGAYKVGDDPHVVNLTLLPVSERDVVEIGERLGVGPVTILSRGYGNCRIGATACKNIWWIKYYNSDDSLILNTIEVVDKPAVALASPEDLSDSAHRLEEILELYL